MKNGTKNHGALTTTAAEDDDDESWGVNDATYALLCNLQIFFILCAGTALMAAKMRTTRFKGREVVFPHRTYSAGIASRWTLRNQRLAKSQHCWRTPERGSARRSRALRSSD